MANVIDSLIKLRKKCICFPNAREMTISLYILITIVYDVFNIKQNSNSKIVMFKLFTVFVNLYKTIF